MKAYTDLEQSKKLAEILPLESADMAWCNNSIRGVNYTDPFFANLHTVKEMQECFDEALNGWDKYWQLIPAWSLAALLAVLDEPYLFKKFNTWSCYVFNPNNHRFISTDLSEPVDTCYEMILKLHELKML